MTRQYTFVELEYTGMKAQLYRLMKEQYCKKCTGRTNTNKATTFLYILLFSLALLRLQSRSLGQSNVPHSIQDANINTNTSLLPPTSMMRQPEPSHDQLRIWVQLTFSTEFDQNLMPHTLHHYISVLGMEPSQILVGLHHSDPGRTKLVEDTKRRLREDFLIEHFSRWFGDYTSDRLWEVRALQRRKVNVSACDWVVRSDADELPAIPGNDLRKFLRETVGAQGYDSVFGVFNDRVAPQGQLSDLTASPTISEQFPLSCNFTKRVAFGHTVKVVAFRGHHQENRGGHALLDPHHRKHYKRRTGHGTKHCGLPSMIRIDHYKWTLNVVSKLEQRYTKYLAKNLHFGESERLLVHIKEHNGTLGTSDLECHHQDPNAFGVNSIYREGKACSKLSVVCPA